MSDVLASYAFLPWIRRGIANAIGRVDGDASTRPRATFPIDLTIETGLGARTAGIELGLHGPGEVKGFDPRVVVRTWPNPGVHDAESNYFPQVELAEADLPWRYTPARASAQDRLRPWIVLAVVAEEEIRSYEEAGGDRLPILTVAAPSALPPLAQSWAWAHAQVTGDKDLTPGELATHLAATRRVIARMLSPRRLDPRTRYRGFLVPAFERGRRAGLGERVGDDVDALAPAWTGAEARPLPVYYAWRFATGEAGDFESLVRLLRARPVPPTVGLRPLDASRPGSGLTSAASRPLSLQGALLAPGAKPEPWPDAERAAFTGQLATLLNKPKELLATPGAVRAVAPPIYGCEHARRWDVGTGPSERPPWLHTLDLDPTWRVVAALGTAVIQEQQRALMAAAWKDADRIRELNQRLAQGQLAREVLDRIWTRHVRTAPAASLLAITAPLHARVKASPLTIRAVIEDSRVPIGLLEAQLRKLTRPRGPIARRGGRPAAAVDPLIVRISRGELVLVAPPVEPRELLTTAGAGAALPDPPPAARVERDRRLERWLRRLAWTLFVLAVVAAAAAPWLGAGVLALGGALAGLGGWMLDQANAIARAQRRTDAVIAMRGGSIAALPIAALPVAAGRAPADFVPAEGTLDRHVPVAPVADAATRARAAAAFQQAAAALVAELGEPLPVIPRRPPLPVAHLVERLHAALDPRATVVAALRSRLAIAPRLTWNPEDPLEPIMAAPEFPQPMYEPLRELSQDWLLPGLEDIPPDTITLLETNQRFVEAYMVGLSHEMARELRWNEFPTDLRGTYFRQFWDVRGYVGSELAERLKDIDPIHGWPKASALGSHSSRRPPPGGKHLVLLIRGELLRRYPNTRIYAVETVLDGHGKRVLGSREEHPVFDGILSPDVSFFGFALSAEQVRGDEDRRRPQGWYFVLQEQPSEPKFGLDVADPARFGAGVRAWDDLAWSHLAASPAALAALTYVDLDLALPDTRGLVDPTSTRWHARDGARASDLAYATLQRPMRLAVHGSDMLPPGAVP